MKKLNLGAGSKKIDGFLNLDKFNTFNPDIVHDLEVFPYPFEDDSIDEIMMSHILEHIGQNPDIFNNIIKELYRICKNSTIINIIVPHPRHDDFLADPTHVKPITALGLQLYDKELNLYWQKIKAANSTLALIHKVNFKIIKTTIFLTEEYHNKMQEKTLSQEQLEQHIRLYNNSHVE